MTRQTPLPDVGFLAVVPALLASDLGIPQCFVPMITEPPIVFTSTISATSLLVIAAPLGAAISAPSLRRSVWEDEAQGGAATRPIGPYSR